MRRLSYINRWKKCSRKSLNHSSQIVKDGRLMLFIRSRRRITSYRVWLLHKKKSRAISAWIKRQFQASSTAPFWCTWYNKTSPKTCIRSIWWAWSQSANWCNKTIDSQPPQAKDTPPLVIRILIGFPYRSDRQSIEPLETRAPKLVSSPWSGKRV